MVENSRRRKAIKSHLLPQMSRPTCQRKRPTTRMTTYLILSLSAHVPTKLMTSTTRMTTARPILSDFLSVYGVEYSGWWSPACLPSVVTCAVVPIWLLRCDLKTIALDGVDEPAEASVSRRDHLRGHKHGRLRLFVSLWLFDSLALACAARCTSQGTTTTPRVMCCTESSWRAWLTSSPLSTLLVAWVWEFNNYWRLTQSDYFLKQWSTE